jgi:predicted flavoprotein YhiN
MLIAECKKFNVGFVTDTDVRSVQELTNEGSSFNYQIIFDLNQIGTRIFSKSLVVATGALSIPTLGGSGFGYELAKQLNLPLVTRQASLVPFMFNDNVKNLCEELSGLSVDVVVTANKKQFEESMLFTHRGLSGPAILQISNYWKPGDSININLLPEIDVASVLLNKKRDGQKITLKRILVPCFQKHYCSSLKSYGGQILKI